MIMRGSAIYSALGAFDPEIKEQQQLLAAAGFDPGPIDGIDGQKTAAAWGRALNAGMPTSLDDAKAWLRRRVASRNEVATSSGTAPPPSAAPISAFDGKKGLLIGIGAAAIAALYFIGGSK